MIFQPAPLEGAYVVDLERLEDERGYFARSWCRKEFEAQGLDSGLVQCNISFNRSRGTVRGMHFQADSSGEVKLVRCTRGAIWDIIIDIRPGSATGGEWVGYELNADNGRMLYIPKGFAHGFQTLEDDSEVFYQMSEFYTPAAARGVRWDDPAFDIRWPLPISSISEKDLSYPDFRS